MRNWEDTIIKPKSIINVDVSIIPADVSMLTDPAASIQAAPRIAMPARLIFKYGKPPAAIPA